MKRDRPSPLRANVAANIRQLRNACGMSQEALADAAEIHRVNISRIERGLQSPSLDHLHWIAQALGVDPTELLKASDDKKSG